MSKPAIEKELYQVRVYQAVSFDGKQETYFNAFESANKKPCKLALVPELNMIRISSSTDDILVPYTNVSAIHLNSKRRKENTEIQKEELKKNSSVKQSEIKRPR